MRIEDKHVRRIVRGFVIYAVSTILLGILLTPIYLITSLLNSISTDSPTIIVTIIGGIMLIATIPILSYIFGWVSEKTIKEWIT